MTRVETRYALCHVSESGRRYLVNGVRKHKKMWSDDITGETWFKRLQDAKTALARLLKDPKYIGERFQFVSFGVAIREEETK